MKGKHFGRRTHPQLSLLAIADRPWRERSHGSTAVNAQILLASGYLKEFEAQDEGRRRVHYTVFWQS